MMKFSSLHLFFLISVLSVKPGTSYTVVHRNLRQYLQIDLLRVTGPESIAFDCQGRGPYIGVSDGRILKWQGSQYGWIEFAYTPAYGPYRPRLLCDGSTNPATEPICGRPLGIKFNLATCELYIADAYFGLLKTGPNGGMTQKVANSVGGVPFRFLNALDIDTETGMVYFTDTSTLYQRRDWPTVINSGDKTGRLLQYNPLTNVVTVLLPGLGFANGLAMSKDNSFLLVVEGATNKIHRFWLRGPKAYSAELFFQLERAADNIQRNVNGEFWVALNNGGVPKASVVPWLTGNPVAVKLDGQGNILEVLDGDGDTRLQSISEIHEYNGWLWVGSPTNSYVGVFRV